MNRTVLFLALAGGLALTALVLGLPRGDGTPSPHVVVTTPLTSSNPPVVKPQGVTGGGSIQVTSRLAHPYIPVGPSETYVTVDLTGMEVPGAKRSPVNLAVVIDRSGSMSGYKLQQAKQAARHLVTLLRDEDRLAIVHYGSDVKSLPSLPATAGNRERMAQFIDGIWDDGGTNISAGLSVGRTQLASAMGGSATVNRLILMSDGQPTEGVSDDEGLKNVVREIRASGITVSAIGVGTDFNEDLMQSFAEYGAGAYGFLEDAGKLSTLFQRDLQQATTAVARNVELSFELPPGTTLGEVLGYRAHQAGNTVRVAMPDFSAGQVERVVVRLNVTGGAAGQSVQVAGLKLAYTDLLANKGVEDMSTLAAVATDVREEVVSRQDKEATVYAARARSAQNLQKAAEAMSTGKKGEAQELLRQNQALFSEAASVAGPAAVAADQAEQAQAMQEYDAADDETSQRAAVKKSKVQALKSFGRMGSTY
ncbi:vWA domain-containing protein [Corallococcus llansteffanensis]|uniref:VWA domain-containing protein n=1 Tax=Corallococcus llansteffanensis TaxID=2316731 RepID=A0A3A8NSW2_9BACT|nr:VWA domain-containing protein [Corallococcus llansteffanensis]RKH44245.1 VWA domain-containing protein [Corallococcus llansteffanensis]